MLFRSVPPSVIAVTSEELLYRLFEVFFTRTWKTYSVPADRPETVVDADVPSVVEKVVHAPYEPPAA